MRKQIYLLLAFVAMVIVIAAPLPQSVTHLGFAVLDRTGQTILGVFVFALILWMTEAIPFHITGMLSIVLMSVLQVAPFGALVREGFGNSVGVFFIGALILAAFIAKSGLGERMLASIFTVTGNSTRKILLGFIIMGVLIAFWVAGMAVAAMLAPLAKRILEREGLQPLKSNFGKALMISCAFGPIIGSIATPAGSGSNPLAMGFISDMAGIELSFVDWMRFGTPTTLLLILPCWLVLLFFFKPEMDHLSITPQELKEELRKLGPISREEKITIALLALTIALWLATPLLEYILGFGIPLALPVILTSSLFFFPGMSRIPWKTIEKEISWNTIILILSGISIGSFLYSSGAAGWLAYAMLREIGGFPAPVQILLVILLTCLMKIGFSSNAVTATILVPIAVALAQQLQVNPLIFAVPAALASPMALILVTSSPTNVIPYQSGYFAISDMAKAGAALTIIMALILTSVIYFVGGF